MFTRQIILIVSALAVHASANCIHGTSLHKRQELPGGTVEVSNFGYTGLLGPLNWAALAAENTACSTSKVQSPINIDDSIGLAAEAPVIDFPPVMNAEFENLGTTLEVIVNGTTTFAGTEFALKQFHFHTPSEHRIAEEYFPLEMHMVHEAADGSGAIAVIAVTFQLSEDGSTTELLTAATQNLADVATPGTVTETGPLDFTELANHLQTTPLFQYSGSLTTPPCAEGLTFLVTQQPLPLNVATYNAMKGVIKFNSRYTQNTLGETNLLEVASAQLAGVAPPPAETAPPVEQPPAEAPPAEAPPAETTVEAHPAPPAPTDVVEHPAPVPAPPAEAPSKVTATHVVTVSQTVAVGHPTEQVSHVEDVTDDADEQHCILGACHPRVT